MSPLLICAQALFFFYINHLLCAFRCLMDALKNVTGKGLKARHFSRTHAERAGLPDKIIMSLSVHFFRRLRNQREVVVSM